MISYFCPDPVTTKGVYISEENHNDLLKMLCDDGCECKELKDGDRLIGISFTYKDGIGDIIFYNKNNKFYRDGWLMNGPNGIYICANDKEHNCPVGFHLIFTELTNEEKEDVMK